MEAWEKISDKHIQRKLANIYQSEWRFNPSVKVFPGIHEPAPSLTYQISHVFQQGPDQYKALLSDLCFQSKQAFCRCLKPDAHSTGKS